MGHRSIGVYTAKTKRVQSTGLLSMLLVGLTIFTLNAGPRAIARENYTPDPNLVPVGENIWKNKSTCRNCHGGLANGVGDVPRDPQGPDLRKTKLTPDQIAETIKCGRPNTAMPYFDGRAYTDKRCYGVTADGLGDQMPPQGRPLSQNQIKAMVAFLEDRFVGKPDPTYQDCLNFWGSDAVKCDSYPEP